MARSLIVAGQGIRLGNEIEAFRKAAQKWPVVTSWLGADLLPTDHQNNIGIIGPCGHPGANKALHEADEILVWGCSMTSAHTGAYQPKAQRVEKLQPHTEEWCKREGAPTFGSYARNLEMTKALPEGTVMVVDGGGTALYTGFQSSYIKEGSRLTCSSTMSAMGSGLPEAIGACFANGKKMTTCLIGEGSLMLNVQELQTIATHRLPIKIFVIVNGGYLAIKQTQKEFQEGRYYGTGGSDVEFPSLWRLADAFGVRWTKKTKYALKYEGPILCEWQCAHDQPMLRQGFNDGKSMPLTTMVIE